MRHRLLVIYLLSSPSTFAFDDQMFNLKYYTTFRRNTNEIRPHGALERSIIRYAGVGKEIVLLPSSTAAGRLLSASNTDPSYSEHHSHNNSPSRPSRYISTGWSGLNGTWLRCELDDGTSRWDPIC